MSKEITLVVMAAGMGSRFGGLKQLEPMTEDGKVLLDFSVYDAIAAGFSKIVFVIKHEIDEDFRRLVGDRIAKRVKVEYVYQEITDLPTPFRAPRGRTKPWGTAQAILACRQVVHEPFAVVNADDYYGKGAFNSAAKFLIENEKDYCMVGFRLANTLTEKGTVSRGVCRVDDAELREITERTRIDAACRYTEDGVNYISLPADAVVSMNLWGLRPDVFPYIEDGFRAFLKEHGTQERSEYYLPTVISSLIERGTHSVKVLLAEDKWYGVTYKEDKDKVTDAIAKMIENKKYEGI